MREGSRALTPILALVLLCAPGVRAAPPAKAKPSPAPAAPSPAPVPPPRPAPVPLAPQVKIDRVLADDPSNLAFVLSAIDEAGKPVSVAESKVDLFVGEGKKAPDKGDAPGPFAAYSTGGKAVSGSRGALKPVAKDGAPLAVVVVAGLHAEVPRDVCAAMPAAIDGMLGALPGSAQVSLLAYHDVLLATWQPGGGVVRMADLNDYQACLKGLRSLAGIPPRPPEGVPCGRLFAGAGALGKAAGLLPAPQGMFPRLLGLDESERMMKAATAGGHFRIDRSEVSQVGGGEGEGEYVGDRFAAGAVEAAIRVLQASSPPDAVRNVVLFSDGRDGYLRAADAVADKVTPGCKASAPACKGAADVSLDLTHYHDIDAGARRCSLAVLDCVVPKVSAALVSRQLAVRARLDELVRMARVAGVRIDAVAVPGTDESGASRLRFLAVRTGGTFQSVATVADLEKTGAVAGERLAQQAVLKPGRSLSSGTTYAAKVVASGFEPASYVFVTGPGRLPGAGPFAKVRAFAIRQLGHTWGTVALWAVAGLLALGLLLLAWKIARAIAGGRKKGGKPPKLPSSKLKRPDAKAPAAPGIPTLKRPG